MMAKERKMVDMFAGELPNNREAEIKVLANILFAPESLDLVLPYLKPEAFYRVLHRTLYEAMLCLNNRGELITPVSVEDELLRTGKVNMLYQSNMSLYALIDLLPREQNIEHYAREVEQLHQARLIIESSLESLEHAREGRVKEAIEVSESLLYRFHTNANPSSPVKVGSLADDFIEELELLQKRKKGVIGVPTDFHDLDRLLGGLNKSDLIILAARPAIGKTSLAFNIAKNAARKGYGIAAFSLEMSKQQLFRRLVANEAGIDQEKLKTGWVDDEEWERMVESINQLCELPLYIDDTPGITVPEMRSKVRQLVAAGCPIDAIVVDYIQLMEPPRTEHRNRNREQDVSEISRSLKGLARELNLPVLALAQLSRAVEQRQNKVPQLSDLRESGAIEQDADVVMFIYRDEVYNPDTERPNMADVIVAKHRNGPVGEVTLFFNKAHNLFADLEYTFNSEEGN